MTAPFERVFTDEHREAIDRLSRHGLSAKEVVRRCANGDAGVPAFKISEATVRRIRRAEAEARGALEQSALAAEDPHRALRQLVRDQIGLTEKRQQMLRRELDRLASHRGKLAAQPWIDRALRETAAALASLERTARNLPAESTNGKREPEGDFIDGLAAKL